MKLGIKLIKQINAFADNELDTKNAYKINKLISENNQIKNYYLDLLKFKKIVNTKTLIETSANFRENLYNKINSLPEKKEKFSVIKSFFEKITLTKLSYLGSAALLLFIAGAVINNLKNTNHNYRTFEIVTPTIKIISNNQSEAQTIGRKDFSSPTSTPKTVNQRQRQSNQVATRLPNSSSDNRTALNQRSANQQRARQLFDKLEKSRKEEPVNIVQYNLEQGVSEFYKNNLNVSRRHFQLVLEKANRNSVQYLQARDYLSRIQER